MSKEIREIPEHECEFFLTMDLCVHSCECEHITVSDASTSSEYVPLEKYQALQKQQITKEALSTFLTWVEDETYFFEDKDVTVEQIVDAYLALDSDSKQ